jgi:hypothetical protein
MEWDTSASGICWWCEYTGRYHRYYKEQHRNCINNSKVVALEINIQKSREKYMLLSHHQNASQYRDIKIATQVIWIYVTVQILGSDSNKSKLDSGGN